MAHAFLPGQFGRWLRVAGAQAAGPAAVGIRCPRIPLLLHVGAQAVVINLLHSRLHRPESGWDPVPQGHVLEYGTHEWASGADARLLDELEQRIGGFAGKQVLDLGGGPGQYSVAFAK